MKENGEGDIRASKQGKREVEIEGEIVASTDEPKSTEEGDEMMNDRKGKGEEELVEGDNLKEGNDVEEDGGVGNDVS